jgi:hypothetical protein
MVIICASVICSEVPSNKHTMLPLEIEKNMSCVFSPKDLKSALAASPLSLGEASIP